MGYSTSTFFLDRKSLIEIWGSNNKETLEGFLSEEKSELQELAADFDLFDELDITIFVNDIFSGSISKPKYAHVYGYLYKMLVNSFGERFDQSHLRDDDVPPFIDIYDKNSAFIPIPFSDDFPLIVSINKEELPAKKSEYLGKKSNHYSDSELDRWREFLEEVFNHAINKDLDLVFISH